MAFGAASSSLLSSQMSAPQNQYNNKDVNLQRKNYSSFVLFPLQRSEIFAIPRGTVQKSSR